jgi:hypothetical protein
MEFGYQLESEIESKGIAIYGLTLVTEGNRNVSLH